MKKKGVVLLFILLIVLPLAGQNNKMFWKGDDNEKTAVGIIDNMTNTELLGQILMFSPRNDSVDGEFIHMLERNGIGSVKLYGRNISDLEKTARDIGRLQSAALNTRFGIPLFIATDQEGGWVRHIKHEMSTTPGSMAIGASSFPYDAAMAGYLIASELAVLGVNMNFAPVVDLYIAHDAYVIGPRSFSDDPQAAGILGTSFMHGQQKVGVISTAKHFPGHGRAETDSHLVLPTIRIDYSTLKRMDLYPYIMMINEGLPAIMSGHLYYPQLVDSIKPASLSKRILTDILRKDLGFEGLIITDDMTMVGANTGEDSLPVSCRKAVEAGNDIILVGMTYQSYRNIIKYLLAHMKTNTEFRERVRQSVKRVLMTKLRYLRAENAVNLQPDPAAVHENLEKVKSNAGSFFLEQACRGVTAFEKNKGEYNPELLRKSSVLVISQFDEFITAGRERLPSADGLLIAYTPYHSARKRTIERVMDTIDGYDTIIFHLSNPNSAQVLSACSEYSDKIIVISSLNPVHIREAGFDFTAFAVFGTGRESFAAAWGALLGDFVPSGTLPFKLKENEKK